MPYYAVANGKTNGVFLDWGDCKKSVYGYKNARYKKFDTREEAERFVSSFAVNKTDPPVSREEESTPDMTYIYTDGSCVNNGKSNAKAGIGIFFGFDDPRNVSQRIDGKQTNNTAELSAIIKTARIIENDVKENKNITICTDSEYAIKCLTFYGEKCCNRNWKDDIPNKELVQEIYELYRDKPNIKFLHIRAHTNNTDAHSVGNEQADKLANLAVR